MVSTVKICGLATAATLEAALDAGADMVGLVFFAKSPRFVGLDHARELAAQARDRAKIVALTVDADDDLLAAIARVVGPDMLQLHGRETPQRVAAIKRAFGLPAMKAIGVAEAADFARARDYEGVADWLLIDAKPPKDAVLPGGNGRPFDWRRQRTLLLQGKMEESREATPPMYWITPILFVALSTYVGTRPFC